MATPTLPSPDPQTSSAPPLTPEERAAMQEAERKQKTIIAILIAIIVVVVISIIGFIIYLMQANTPTDKIRDVFIIIMALESLVIGVAMIVLIVQLASLIN